MSTGASAAPRPIVPTRIISQHAEDAADHVRRCGALEERQAGDVDERVPEPEHGECDERDPQVWPDPDRGERRAQEDDPEPEVGREALAPDQREGGERAEHAADAARGVQQADRRVTAVEQLECGDDDEDAERGARKERLRRIEPDDDAKLPVAGDRLEPPGGLAQEPAGLALSRLRTRAALRPGSARRAPRPRRTLPRRRASRLRGSRTRAARPRSPGRRRCRRSRSCCGRRSRRSAPPVSARARGEAPIPRAGMPCRGSRRAPASM